MTGEELKKKLLDAGFFPGQLAKKLNISHQSMYAKLARNDIRLGFIEQLCEVTGLQLADFIDVPRNPNESALMDMLNRKDDIILKQAEEIGRLKEKIASMQ